MVFDAYIINGFVKIFVYASVFLGGLFLNAHAANSDAKELSMALRGGGYIIYWRHGKTEKGQRDAPNVNLKDCLTQRNLSPDGRQQAIQIGNDFRRIGIQIDKVLTSPYCRCYDTGYLAFGRAQKDHSLYFSIDMNKSIRDVHSQKLIEYMSTKPIRGKNTVIIGHTANLKEATNIWPSTEGVMHIFKPEKSRFSHMGFILPEQWSDL